MSTTIDRDALLDFIPFDHRLRHEWWSAVLRNSIASQIKGLRESRGWTQEALAKALQTTQSVVARLEHPQAKNPPTVETLLRIASIFDVGLMVRFEGWGQAVAFVAGKVVPLSFDQEQKLCAVP